MGPVETRLHPSGIGGHAPHIVPKPFAARRRGRAARRLKPPTWFRWLILSGGMLAAFLLSWMMAT